MEERFSIRSVCIIVILAVLCTPSEQRPRCKSPADCGENALGMGELHYYRSLNPKYISRIEELTGVKELMEKLLMQHNELTDGNESGAEEEEDSSERPPFDVKPMSSIPIEVEENSTERPPTATTSSAIEDEGTSTERPPVQNSLADVFDQPKLGDESEHGSKYLTTPQKANDEESFWELTTVEPQLISPMDEHEYHFEMTTIQPPKRIMEPIHLDNSDEQVKATTLAPVDSTRNKNISSYLVNLPPTKASNRNKIKRTTTKGAHVIIHPQQLNTPSETTATLPPSLSSSANHGKIKRKPTTKPNQKISTLMLVDRDHDVKGEIQLETLNRPISRRKPTATPVGSATSNRPKKKPINIIPESVVVKQGAKPAVTWADKPQGSPGIRNPIPNSVANSAPPREPEDYLISALASIADGDEENTDAEEDDEEEEDEEENSNENEGEDEDEDEDEDEYLSDSEEEIEERENVDSVNASDVISTVMEEVDALL